MKEFNFFKDIDDKDIESRENILDHGKTQINYKLGLNEQYKKFRDDSVLNANFTTITQIFKLLLDSSYHYTSIEKELNNNDSNNGNWDGYIHNTQESLCRESLSELIDKIDENKYDFLQKKREIFMDINKFPNITSNRDVNPFSQVEDSSMSPSSPTGPYTPTGPISPEMTTTGISNANFTPGNNPVFRSRPRTSSRHLQYSPGSQLVFEDVEQPSAKKQKIEKEEQGDKKGGRKKTLKLKRNKHKTRRRRIVNKRTRKHFRIKHKTRRNK
tara:strand:+ start:1 stop:813 length:813 start_codon:yes stop_codon:yes gene_type:complete